MDCPCLSSCMMASSDTCVTQCTVSSLISWCWKVVFALVAALVHAAYLFLVNMREEVSLCKPGFHGIPEQELPYGVCQHLALDHVFSRSKRFAPRVSFSDIGEMVGR